MGDYTEADNLLHSILAEAPRLAEVTHMVLQPMAVARRRVREALLADGLIMPIGEPDPEPVTIAAVDGGFVKQPGYAIDTLFVLATSAAGMSSAGGGGLPLYGDHWEQPLVHTSDNDRLMSAAMASLELALIDRLQHGLRILDGSTTSPVITLWSALSIRNPAIRSQVIDLLTDEVLGSVYSLGDPTHRTHPGRVVALPKSDSGRYFLNAFGRTPRLNLSDKELPGGDRFMAAMVLEPGEMLYPRPGVEHRNLTTEAPEQGDQDYRDAAARLADATKPIVKAAHDKRLVVTYLKPESADTAIKAEVNLTEPLPDFTGETFAGPDFDHPSVIETRKIARYLSDETHGPHMQEPFAQHAVDLRAKEVSIAAEAMQQAVFANLPEGSDDYLTLLARSYRTTTGRPSGGGR